MFTAAVLSFQVPVNAANYGGFGSTYSAVVDPKTAVLNDETIKSDDFKAGLSGLSQLRSVLNDLIASLVSLNTMLFSSLQIFKIQIEKGCTIRYDLSNQVKFEHRKY